MLKEVTIRRRAALMGGVFALGMGFAGIAAAQDVNFEGETIEIMGNFAAGGGTDTAAGNAVRHRDQPCRSRRHRRCRLSD